MNSSPIHRQAKYGVNHLSHMIIVLRCNFTLYIIVEFGAGMGCVSAHCHSELQHAQEPILQHFPLLVPTLIIMLYKVD